MHRCASSTTISRDKIHPERATPSDARFGARRRRRAGFSATSRLNAPRTSRPARRAPRAIADTPSTRAFPFRHLSISANLSQRKNSFPSDVSSPRKSQPTSVRSPRACCADDATVRYSTETHLRRHLDHMVSGFERSTAVRIPKNDVKTYHDFVSRDPAFENSDKSLAVVVHKSNKSKGAADGEAMDVDVDVDDASNAHAILAAWEGFPAVSYADDERVSVAMHGHVSNAPEIRELYGLPRADPVAVDNAPATPDNANGPRRSHRISGNKATMDVDDTAVHKGNTAGMHASNRSPQIEGAR